MLGLTRVVLPLAALRPCEGSRQEPVELDRQSEHAAVLRWNDGGVPQAVPVELLECDEKFPAVPERWEPNPPRLLAALTYVRIRMIRVHHAI